MYNKAILIGRLTAEPELKQTPSGVYLVNFQIAVDRRFRSKDGERQADFITIVCWRQQAEFVARYFHKGDPIGIDGSIQSRNYEDRNGNKRNTIEVVASEVFFVGVKSENRNTQSQLANDFTDVEEDDLPFN